MDRSVNRRDFLRLAGLTALSAAGACTAPRLTTTTTPAATALPTIRMFPTGSGASSPLPPTEVPATPRPTESARAAPGKRRVLRIAHLTDFHVQPGGIAAEGMRRALQHAQSQADPPDVIFNTGDCVMDSLQATRSRTTEQWRVFHEILEVECRLPIYHAIGNHDVWGWGTGDRSIETDPLYGKAMALEQLGLSNPYYSFDRAGWHFIVLDSTHPRNAVSKHPYIGRLDDEQFRWLMAEVDSAQDRPICLLSHIPVVAACEYFDGPNEESGNWVVPGSWMHIDARRFRDFFVKRPNVRLCLSGHTHQYEVLDYLGVRYMTNGAVCGNWWNGPYMDFPPAYVMVDLYEDGSADSQFVPYFE